MDVESPLKGEGMATESNRHVPPLVAGDKLSRQEFMRRWEAHPEINKAELLGGMVYTSSRVTAAHGSMHADVGGWLATYRAATEGTASGHRCTLFLLEDIPQPDINLRILAEFGGASWVKDEYLHGAPELLAEICESSASYDLHVKFDLYQAARVREYLVVLLYEREIRWHVLVHGQYELLRPDADGLRRSRIFPGLWLDGKALLAGNLRQVLAGLQEGLASPEHQRFAEELAARKAAGKS